MFLRVSVDPGAHFRGRRSLLVGSLSLAAMSFGCGK
jgi:hypothetical protein